MEYITVRQAAERWDISQRLVQKYCAEGRIEGARKFGASWVLPACAEKPRDPRREKRPAAPAPVQTERGKADGVAGLMPLMNTPFLPGHCLETIAAMPDGAAKDIARAEYHYFSGEPELAVRVAERHLKDPDMAVRLSACLLYAYANLPLGQIRQAVATLEELNARADPRAPQLPPALLAAKAFVASTAAVLLHLPPPDGLPPAETCLPLLPPGLRAFAMYVQAHYAYLQGEYAKSLGIVQATFGMQDRVCPIPAIYLHLVAVMDYMSLRRPDEAQTHLLAAWDLARPDDLIQGFGEHHGLLGGMLEAVIKKDWPEDFKRIIAITYRFSAGWRKVHNPIAGHDVADNLTTTEFAVAMLAARGWTNQEIAEHMDLSANTVKRYISLALQKLGVAQRQDLKQYMLP